jgi:co-chaperonin GroES (HSP10)
MSETLKFDGDDLTPEQIPVASGYTILLAPIKIESKTSGGIILASGEVKMQNSTRFISKVLAVGPLAYTGDKFKPHPNAPSIPFCKVGDVVAHGQYSGAQLPCSTPEGGSYYLRFMNDDEIKMVVEDTSILDIGN